MSAIDDQAAELWAIAENKAAPGKTPVDSSEYYNQAERTSWRRRAVSQLIHKARATGASFDTIFPNTSQELRTFISKEYNRNLNNETDGITKNLQMLLADDTRVHVDPYLGYSMFGENFTGRKADVSGHKAANTITQLFSQEFFAKAKSSAFIPYDSDFFPTPDQIDAVPELASLFESDPAVILEGFVNGLGQDASQRIALNSVTGNANISFKKILDILERQGKDGHITNRDGEQVDTKGWEGIIRTQRKKHEVLSGRGSMNIGSDSTFDAVAKYGPDVIRAVYGTNLPTAIGIVEGMLSTLGTLVSGQGITAPIQRVISMFKYHKGKTSRKEMAQDILYILNLTVRDEGASPFSDDIDSQEAIRAGGQKGLRWFFKHGHLKHSAMVDMQIRHTNAIIGRRFMLKRLNNGSMLDIAKEIAYRKEQGTLPATQKEWKNMLRNPQNPDVSKTGKFGIRNFRVAMMLRDANLLTVEGITTLQELILNSKQGVGMIRLDEMSAWVMGDPRLTSAQRSKYSETIKGLDLFDKEFNRQYMLDHRVLDSATPESSAAKMLYAYRNFPINFTINRTLRDSSRMSPIGFMAKQIKHMVLDMIYMSVIQIAAGRDPQDLIDEWEDQPFWNFGRYAARVPIAGPWGGLIAQWSISAVQAGTGNGSMLDPSTGPISIAALNTMIRTLTKTAADVISGNADAHSLTESGLAVLRLAPFGGGALTRAVLQMANNSALGQGAMGVGKGGGGGGGSGSNRPPLGQDTTDRGTKHQRLLPPTMIPQRYDKPTFDEHYQNTPLWEILNMLDNGTGDFPVPLGGAQPTTTGAVGRLGGTTPQPTTGGAPSGTTPPKTPPPPPKPPKTPGGTPSPTTRLPQKEVDVMTALSNKMPKAMPEGIT